MTTRIRHCFFMKIIDNTMLQYPEIKSSSAKEKFHFRYELPSILLEDRCYMRKPCLLRAKRIRKNAEDDQRTVSQIMIHDADKTQQIFKGYNIKLLRKLLSSVTAKLQRVWLQLCHTYLLLANNNFRKEDPKYLTAMNFLLPFPASELLQVHRKVHNVMES